MNKQQLYNLVFYAEEVLTEINSSIDTKLKDSQEVRKLKKSVVGMRGELFNV